MQVFNRDYTVFIIDNINDYSQAFFHKYEFVNVYYSKCKRKYKKYNTFYIIQSKFISKDFIYF
jgi:hypothetical protein